MIQKNLNVYHHANDLVQAGIASYDVETGIKAIKRKAPIFSMSKAKQHVLWDEGKYFSR